MLVLLMAYGWGCVSENVVPVFGGMVVRGVWRGRGRGRRVGDVWRRVIPSRRRAVGGGHGVVKEGMLLRCWISGFFKRLRLRCLRVDAIKLVILVLIRVIEIDILQIFIVQGLWLLPWTLQSSCPFGIIVAAYALVL